MRTLVPLLFIATMPVTAQPGDLLVHDEHHLIGDMGEDPSPDLNRYDRFNRALGADSARYCNGHPCIGWVEDRYGDGTLKHRGFYEDGLLVVYRNYHPDGQMERDFKPLDNVKSIMRTFHRNGQVRSEARYADGVSFEYRDHYVNGHLRYVEERHRKQPYFIRMDLYDGEGRPISLLELVDRKRVEFLQKEYHPGGLLKSEGRARYNASRMDTHRIGTWKYYEPDGTLLREEDYVDGRVHAVR